jgi:hypothetical protein
MKKRIYWWRNDIWNLQLQDIQMFMKSKMLKYADWFSLLRGEMMKLKCGFGNRWTRNDISIY